MANRVAFYGTIDTGEHQTVAEAMRAWGPAALPPDGRLHDRMDE